VKSPDALPEQGLLRRRPAGRQADSPAARDQALAWGTARIAAARRGWELGYCRGMPRVSAFYGVVIYMYWKVCGYRLHGGLCSHAHPGQLVCA
jgi:hypothetical protein